MPPESYDVITVSRAVRRLGIRESDARAWLAERRLIVEVAGQPRVSWRAVLDELDKLRPAAPGEATPPPPSPNTHRPRAGLRS